MDRIALAADLREAGYLADDRTVLVSGLAIELGKPVLVEGPAGVGKTELAKALAKVTGREIPVKEEGRRPGDPAALVASSQKIRDELGWVPRKPDVETMIADAWAWFEAHPQGYGG